LLCSEARRETEVLVNATFAPFDDGEVHLEPSSYRIDGPQL